MNVLITGGAGFIGSSLTEKLLQQQHSIICLDNFDGYYHEDVKKNNLTTALQNKNFQLVGGDIRDRSILDQIFQQQQVDVVIHLAALAGVRPSIENPTAYYDVNVNGTLHLLEAMRFHQVKRMLFASSSSVYGNNSKVPFAESDNVDFPISPYAATKKTGELMCHTYHHLYGFDIFCLRFFTVFGPRQRPDLAIHKFANAMIQGNSIQVYGDGSTSRDYTYIDDITDGIVAAMQHLKGFEVFNLGESKTITLLQMITTLEEALQIQAKKIPMPMQAGDVNCTYADISKAKSMLAYQPKVDFSWGIRRFVEWKTGTHKH